MISSLAYHLIAGLPLVAYLGMATLILLFSTATVGFLNYRGNTKIPFRWHPRLAAATLAVAAVHAVFALSAYIGF
ncbi:MAG: hypothetical protein WC831_02895 [Parcubacteria group bacterium]|jgi:hypothetical protein